MEPRGRCRIGGVLRKLFPMRGMAVFRCIDTVVDDRPLETNTRTAARPVRV